MAVTATDRSMGGAGEPASYGFAITPDDAAELDYITRAIWIGAGSGAIKVTLQGGDVVTLIGIITGTLLPLRARKVWSTGTTASSIIGLY